MFMRVVTVNELYGLKTKFGIKTNLIVQAVQLNNKL